MTRCSRRSRWTSRSTSPRSCRSPPTGHSRAPTRPGRSPSTRPARSPEANQELFVPRKSTAPGRSRATASPPPTRRAPDTANNGRKTMASRTGSATIAARHHESGGHPRSRRSPRCCGSRPAHPRAARRRSADPRQGVRPQPLRAVHAPGPFARRRFPRVLGIEAVGLVEEAPGGEFRRGDTVATAMGGMGRQFDGGYAEYTCVPARRCRPSRPTLPWETLGALPEMLQTAWGSLFKSLRLRGGRAPADPRRHDLGRPRRRGDRQASTARSSPRRPATPTARHCCAPAASIRYSSTPAQSPPRSKKRFRRGVDKVLELVGTTTLRTRCDAHARAASSA